MTTDTFSDYIVGSANGYVFAGEGYFTGTSLNIISVFPTADVIKLNGTATSTSSLFQYLINAQSFTVDSPGDAPGFIAVDLGGGDYYWASNHAIALGTSVALSTAFGHFFDAPSAPSLSLSAGSDSGVVGDRVTNIATPSLIGVGTPGDTIDLYGGSGIIPIGAAIVASDGDWSVQPSAALAAGVHSLTVTETSGGGTSPASAPLAITIDITLPPAPTASALAAASDSGVPGDDVTNVTTPAIIGHGAAGDVINLYDGPVDVGSGIVGADGAWSINAATLDAGTHNLTTTQTDYVGNVSPSSAALALTIDTTVPAATSALALSPASDSGMPGDDLTDVTTPAITGTGGIGDTVTLYDGSAAIGSSVITAADGSWSITPTAALSDGSHSLTAEQTDYVGNVSPASAALTLTIDTTVPAATSAPVLAPASDSGVPGDDLTDVTTPAINGTGAVGDTVILYDGGAAIGSSVITAAAGSWSITPTAALSDGPHSLTAEQTDPAGSVSPASAGLALTIDTTAPAAPSALALSPASDSGVPDDDLTDVALPTINSTGAVGDTVTLYDGSAAIGSVVVAAAGGAWSITPIAALANGLHSLTAEQTDAAGSASPASAGLALTIDTTVPAAPSALALSPASDSGVPGDGLTDVATPAITGTGAVGDTVTLYDGAAAIGSSVITAGDGSWSLTPAAALAEGPHSLTATQTSPAGDVSPVSAALELTIDTAVPVAPSGLTLAPASDSGVIGDGLTDVATPAITGTGAVGDTVTLYDDGIAVGSVVVTAADGSWSITPAAALAEGPHSLTATQASPAGDVSLVSAALALTIDTAVPVAPSGLTLAPASDSGVIGDGLTDVATPAITGTGAVGDTVTLYDDGIAVGSVVVTAADGSWSITLTAALADGPHSVTATQTSPAGGLSPSSAALALTIDTTVPPATSALALAPASDSGVLGDNITDVATPVITGTGAVGDTVTLYDDGVAVGSVVVTAMDGSWSITPAAELADGPHSVTATQTTPAGDVSPSSAPLALTIDTAALVAPSGLALPPASDSGVLGDNLTDITEPVITGTGVTGDTVSLYDGGVLIGSSVITASDGSWSITPAATLADGLHSLTATEESPAGDVSAASATLPITIDTAAPAVPTLQEDVSSTDPAKPVISGLAESGDLIRLYQDGASIGSAVAAAGGWKFTYPDALTVGGHSLTVTATDAAGETSAASQPLSLVVSADDSYAVVTPPDAAGDTKSYVYDSGGVLSTVQTTGMQGQVLTSVTDTSALINIYDTAGTLIGTITQPSTSAFSEPVFATTPDTLAASTGSGPIGSVVDLLDETNDFLSQGDDTITTHSGDATIIAVGASTTVTNVDADLTFYGGTGTTTVYGGAGSITAIGGSGGGTLFGGAAGHSVLVAGGGVTTIVGGGEGDGLFGSATGTDTIFGDAGPGDGDETLVGGAGTELLIARSGDAAFGGAGRSTLFSDEDGGSILVGGSGTSVLVAEGGSEDLWGGSGTSTLWAGSGADVLGGNADVNSTTVMVGGAGDDVFVGSGGTATAYGGAGKDVFWGGSGALQVFGGSGQDTVVFGSGAVTVSSGTGADLYDVTDARAGGTDVITGFKVGVDQISLFGYGTAAVQQHVTGAGIQLLLADNTSILLAGVTLLATNSIQQS